MIASNDLKFVWLLQTSPVRWYVDTEHAYRQLQYISIAV